MKHSVTWGTAVSATLHCLTGCALGEILGMVISTALGFANAGNIVLSTALAFVFGYTLTMRGVLRGGMAFKAALGVAFAADTVSILVMELVDNTGVALIPGALDAQLNTWLFWWSLALSLFVAFWIAVPVNHALMRRGLGHAKVHAMHSGHSASGTDTPHVHATNGMPPHETPDGRDQAHA